MNESINKSDKTKTGKTEDENCTPNADTKRKFSVENSNCPFCVLRYSLQAFSPVSKLSKKKSFQFLVYL